jgi:hypothetical protein
MIPEGTEYKHIKADFFQSIQKIFDSNNLAFFYFWVLNVTTNSPKNNKNGFKLINY